jgi:F-type H+-transporting ATPase subunit b
MGGIKELGFDLPVLIAQIVNVLILFGLMYLVAYKPVLKMLDARSQKVKEGIEQRESIKVMLSQTEEDAKAKLSAAEKEGQVLINRAVHDGEEIKKRAEEEARQEAETLLERERSRIQREREEALEELRRQFADLTITAAEKVIQRSLNKEDHRVLINKVLDESIGANGESQA